MRVGVCSGVELEAWLRWFAYPLDGVECRGYTQYPAFTPNTHFFLPALQKWQLGFEALCIFLSIICSSCTYTQLFLVPYSIFVFCCSKRHLSRYQHCSKGPRVPACLTPRSLVALSGFFLNPSFSFEPFFCKLVLGGSQSPAAGWWLTPHGDGFNRGAPWPERAECLTGGAVSITASHS